MTWSPTYITLGQAMKAAHDMATNIVEGIPVKSGGSGTVEVGCLHHIADSPTVWAVQLEDGEPPLDIMDDSPETDIARVCKRIAPLLASGKAHMLMVAALNMEPLCLSTVSRGDNGGNQVAFGVIPAPYVRMVSAWVDPMRPDDVVLTTLIATFDMKLNARIHVMDELAKRAWSDKDYPWRISGHKLVPAVPDKSAIETVMSFDDSDWNEQSVEPTAADETASAADSAADKALLKFAQQRWAQQATGQDDDPEWN